jgi:hypothetical protein
MALCFRKQPIAFKALTPARRRPGIFKSDVFGTYYHQYLTIEIPWCETDQDMTRLLDSLPESAKAEHWESFEKRVEHALTAAAYLHEMRHFHDCFGTVAGITLFLNDLHIIDLFLRACLTLRRTGQHWRIPVTEWVRDNRCPEEVKRALLEFQMAHKLRLLFLGNIRLPVKPGSTREIVRLFLPTGGFIRPDDLAIPAFPTNIKLSRKGRLVPHIGFVPLGFEALIEGNAQAIQRTMIEGWWGKEVAAEVWRRMTHIEMASEEEDPSPNLYLATDFMVTRRLREVYSISEFSRDLILDFTDKALMESRLYSTAQSLSGEGLTTAIEYIHPGLQTLKHIKQISSAQNPIPERGAPSGTGPVANGETFLWDLVRQAPPVEELLALGARRPPVTAIVRSFVLNQVVKPLLEIRRRSDGRAFRTIHGYVEYHREMPQVPFIVYKSQSCIAPYVSSFAVRECLIQYIFIERIMNALFEARQQPIIFCPRRFSRFPGARFMNFARSRSCQDWISEMACGSWQPGYLADLPDCNFRNTLDAFRVEALPLPQ